MRMDLPAESINTTDLHDSTARCSQLSTASAPASDSLRKFLKCHDYWNILNSRHIFYASKKASSSVQPEDDYKSATASELDNYMDTLLERYIQEQMVNCATDALYSADLDNSYINKPKKQSSGDLKINDRLSELVKLNILYHEISSREEQDFLKSLDESDNWHDLEEEYKERYNEALNNVVESSQNDNKLHEMIKANNLKTKKLEEINKTLLLGVDVDYFKDEISKKIMFTS